MAGAFRGARDIDINGLVNDLKSAENGMIVFASCSGKEKSMESATWQHGAFTSALLEGLNGQCANVGNITHMALGTYVTNRVKELTNGAQHVTFAIPKALEDFPIAAV